MNLADIGTATRYALGGKINGRDAVWLGLNRKRLEKERMMGSYEARLEAARVENREWLAKRVVVWPSMSELVQRARDKERAGFAPDKVWREYYDAERERMRSITAERQPIRDKFTAAANGKRAELMMMLRASGLTLRQVGELAGVSSDRVRQIIEKKKREIRSPRKMLAFSHVVKGRAKVDASQPGDVRNEWIG